MSFLRHRNEAIRLRNELARRHVHGRIERTRLIAIIDIVQRGAPALPSDRVVLVAADAICARRRASWLVRLIGPGPQELTHPDDLASIDEWGHAG